MIQETTRQVRIDCPLCRSERQRPLFDREGYVHVECDECGLVFVNPQPVDVAGVNAQLFGQDHPVWGSLSDGLWSLPHDQLQETIQDLVRSTPARHRRELGFMEDYRKQDRLLDVGCATGKFLLAARARGWQVTGIEVAPENAKVARELFGLDVHEGTLESAELPEAAFDAARANQVLEHLQDPLTFLRHVARAVRPGGCLVLATVNYRSVTRLTLGSRWSYLGGAHNAHVCFFTPRTLTRILHEAGFRVVRFETAGVRFRNPGSGRGRMLKLVEKAAGSVAGPLRLGGRIKAFALRNP